MCMSIQAMSSGSHLVGRGARKVDVARRQVALQAAGAGGVGRHDDRTLRQGTHPDVRRRWRVSS